MAEERTAKKAPYRWHAFTHWANLAFLAGVGVAGVVVDPILWVLAAPLELGALWVIPDLPPFRLRVDQRQAAKELANERAYYLAQLWGLARKRRSLGEWILEMVADVDDEDTDKRVIKKDAAFQQYVEMREIIAKLVELEKVRGGPIVSHEMNRFEQVVNGYLRYLVACRSLTDALRGVDGARLRRELAELDGQLKDSTGDLRAVLLERKHLREGQLERLPKLQATLELFRTRADAIVYQMRNIHGQVLADPGVNVNAFLEDMVEKHELMADPLGELEADQAVREMLHTSADKSDDRRRLIGLQGGKGIRQG